MPETAVTSLGSIVTSLGLTVTTRTGLDAGLDAHYKLDETSGTVVRNEVRTLTLGDSFNNGGTTDAYGDIPTGWNRYTFSVGGSDTLSASLSGGVYTLSPENGTDGNLNFGISRPDTLVSGRNYVLRVRYRITERTGGVFQYYNGSSFGTIDNAAGDWQTKDLSFTAGGTLFILTAVTPQVGDSLTLEIDSITIYEENAGTYVNSPTLGVPGKVGTAVTYNGTSQYANCPVAPTSYPFTMSGWCKPDNFDAAMRIFQVNDLSEANVLWGLAIAADGNLLVVRRNTTDIQTDTGIAMAAGVFTHLAVVFEDATTARVYVDGSLAYSNDSLTSVSFSSGADGMLLGLRSTVSVGGYFDGALDDIRLYSRALSPTEAKALWLTGYPYRRSSIVQPIVRRPVQPILQ